MMKSIFLLAAISMCLSLTYAQDPSTTIGTTGTVTANLNGKQTKYTTVRAQDGNIWLHQNLGSAMVAKSYSHDLGFGDLYAWGRWSDGHELRLGKYIKDGTAEPNNPEGVKQEGNKNPYYYTESSTGWWWAYGNVYDKWQAKDAKDVSSIDGCDPCKQALGEVWRLPTADEWKKLIELEGITDVESAYDSNLKLTAGGYRSVTTGKINGLKHYGRYWSSTAATKGNAFLLTYTAKDARVGAIARGAGASIRCVKNK